MQPFHPNARILVENRLTAKFSSLLVKKVDEAGAHAPDAAQRLFDDAPQSRGLSIRNKPSGFLGPGSAPQR